MPLPFLNLFFHITHVLIISFILIGWAFKKTRLIHAVFLLLTIFSWIGLGYFYGWGYCFWTDWHWGVRDRMGLTHPSSYIKLAVDSITGKAWDPRTIDIITAAVFLIVLVITGVLTIRKSRR